MLTFFENHPKFSWLITLIGAVLIFYISSLSFPPGAKAGTNFNAILYHILAFFLFALFLFVSILRGKKNYLIFFLAITLSIFYAISDELHQFFVPGRSCAFSDVFLDFVGISLASLVYLIRIKLKSN